MYEIERRTILWKLPIAAAAFIAAIPDVLRGGSGKLTWDEFTARATALANDLAKGSDYDEEAYIYRLASDAVSVPDVPVAAKTRAFAKLDPPVEFGPAYRGAPIVIIQWRLAPNAWLPPHNHPHYNVLSVGLEGEAIVTHYDIEGDAPPFDVPASSSTFTVRRTRETLVAPRRISPLTSTRDNIHTFKAGPRGARGIDINTPRDKDIGFSFLNIDAKAIDATRGTFAAKWIGQNPTPQS